ncbi:MAG: MarR family transcriptional regulator [Clostridia bacterium]
MDEFAKNLSEKLTEIYKNVTRLEENALRDGEINLTISEIHFVMLLNNHKDGLRVSEIAKEMDVSKPTVTVAVNKLVKKGYANKESGTDARQVNVKLSPEGQRVAILHKKCQREVVKKLGNEFSDNQREVLLKAIDRLNLYFKPKESIE